MNDIHVGTSGYSYKDWVGKFYPKDIKPEDYLSYYATKFDTVELNVTFYRTPTKSMFEGWYTKTPQDFHFVVKGSQYITHRKRLRDCEVELNRFLRAARPLGEKLKVILWQLPPNFSCDLPRLATFLRALRQNVVAVKKLHHESVSLVRHAFEFRHRSWITQETYEILRKHNAALVFSDHPFNITKPATADFIYIRRHGPQGKYHLAYPNRDLQNDVRLIRQYHLLTYEFFNNDIGAVGAKNALELCTLINVR